jgi:hypothetical protein
MNPQDTMAWASLETHPKADAASWTFSQARLCTPRVPSHCHMDYVMVFLLNGQVLCIFFHLFWPCAVCRLRREILKCGGCRAALCSGNCRCYKIAKLVECSDILILK